MECPDPAVIQDLLAGELPTGEHGELTRHLDDCDDCRRVIAALVADPADRAGARAVPAMTIARYVVTGLLGEGGMGTVYGARDPELARDVAIKLLRVERGGDEASSRLAREARAMAQIDHPNVIAIHDVGTWEGQVFIAMERATGGTLRAWCKGRDRGAILAAYVAAGRGLAAAHAAGVVHRDFKPDNVLLRADGRVCVTDFGLARSVEGDGVAAPVLAEVTLPGSVAGTPGYMAPEQYDAARSDARTDQFAFCVSLWEALGGQRPFVGTSEIAIAEAVMTTAITPPPVALPRRIERVLRRGLARDPGARWPTMDALLAALTARRGRTLAIAAAASAVVIAVVVGIGVVVTQAGHATGGPAAVPDAARLPVERELERGDALFGHDDKLGGAAAYDSALALARMSGSERVLAATLVAHARVARAYRSQFDVAERELVEAVTLAESTDDSDVKARAIAELVTVLTQQGKTADAARWRGLAKGTAKRATTPEARARALEAAASDEDDLAKSLPLFDEALAIWDTDPTKLANHAANRWNVAYVLFRADRIPDARAQLVATLALIEAHPTDAAHTARAKYLALYGLGRLDLLEGTWTRAQRYGEAALAVAQTMPALTTYQAEGFGILADARAHQGDAAGAREAFAAAVAHAEGNPDVQIDVRMWMAEVALFEQRDDDAVIEADTAVATATRVFGEDSRNTSWARSLQCIALAAPPIQRDRVLATCEPMLAHAADRHLTARWLADLSCAVALALPDDQRARARGLATTAADYYHRLGVPDRDRLLAALAPLLAP